MLLSEDENELTLFTRLFRFTSGLPNDTSGFIANTSGDDFRFRIDENLDAGNRTINYNKFEPVNRIFSHVQFNTQNPGNGSEINR